jgi:hypothetical protein
LRRCEPPPEHDQAELMRRLGYTGFAAQGGDWGAAMTQAIGMQAPPGLLGVHANVPGTTTAEVVNGSRQATRLRRVSPTRSEPPTNS